jgi:hypothetical protein
MTLAAIEPHLFVVRAPLAVKRCAACENNRQREPQNQSHSSSETHPILHYSIVAVPPWH